MPTIPSAQRFRKDHPCPICHGYDQSPRGQGERCYGFLSTNGQVAHCTRDQYAGQLRKNLKSNTYAHRLRGDCRCGVRHDPSPSPQRQRIEATYDYADEQGQLLFQAVRYRKADGDKTFSQRRPNGHGGWIWNLKGVRRVPYRLPELLAAIQAGRTILLPEGEKDVDRLIGLGYAASCNPMGAKKWPRDFARYFQGAGVVVVLADNDHDGRDHAVQVCASLLPVVSTVKRHDFTDLPKGGDVSDWWDAGHTADDLDQLLARAPVVTAEDLEALGRDDAGSGGRGEANDEATPQDATQAVETLLAQLKETPDVRLVFQALASLARLPTEAWSPLKGQLKQLLGAALNLNDLEKARKEARSRAEPAGDPDRSGASVLAEEIASAWRGRVIFDRTRRRWLRYGFNSEGAGRWWEQTEEQMLRKIGHELTERLPDGYNWSFLQGMERLLRVALEGALAVPSRELLPLRNGVLDLRTMQLGLHAPEHGFTWGLPFDYDPLSTCDPIKAWLFEAQDGDEPRVQVLLAYARAVVCGRVTLQRFLELVGPGGTGKGTFERLLMALVGLTNVHVTDLRQLESNRFETSNILGKRLVVITDADRYGGPVQVLKALTGGDALRNERKYDPDAPHFTPEAMVIVAANEAIESTDYTSGLERRRLSIPFHRQPATVRQLIDFDRGQAVGEFVPYLPGLLNTVLAIDDVEMERLLRQTDQRVPSLREAWRRSLVETNSLAAWADEHLRLDPEATSPIGVAEEVAPGHYLRADEWLYASYRGYAHAAGERQPISMRRFRRLLEDFCRHQLKLTTVESDRNDTGASCISGIRLRHTFEPVTPGFIEQALPLVGHEVTLSPQQKTPAVDGTDGYLMDQTLGTDGTDGTDGFSKNPRGDPSTLSTVGASKVGGGGYRNSYEANPSDPSVPSGARVSPHQASHQTHQTRQQSGLNGTGPKSRGTRREPWPFPQPGRRRGGAR
jgi:P4 family phage/plasmid primase-like protien